MLLAFVGQDVCVVHGDLWSCMVQSKGRQKLPRGTMLCQISSKGQQQLYTQILHDLACALVLLNLIGFSETQPQVLCCSADCLCSLRNRDTQVQQHFACSFCNGTSCRCWYNCQEFIQVWPRSGLGPHLNKFLTVVPKPAGGIAAERASKVLLHLCVSVSEAA